MYELLIKGGVVIDPAQGIHDQRDVAISQGRIVALASDIAPSEVKKVIDAKGKIVVPGLIDLHAHVADGIIQGATPPDEVGVLTGVTTVCDAGSTGYANFTGFRRFVIPQARTDIFCLLHMCSVGEAILPEIWSWQNINPEATLKTIEENRDIVKGIKLRATGAVMQNLGVEAVRVAKRISNETTLPLMVHIGIDAGETIPEDTVSTFTREMLSLLDRGDILTHVFTPKPGGVISPDGSVFPEFKEARQRGLVLDIGQGRFNWSLEIAREGLEMGILPTTMGTDLFSLSINGPVFSLPVTMSKFLTVGLTLHQLIEMTTINPARVLGEEQRRGSLGVGMPADVSLLELTEGDFLFADGIKGKTFKGTHLLVPKLTLKSGVEIKAQPRFKQAEGT